MRITINYESSWRNSFLDGNNNGPLPKNGRKYIASSSNLNDRKSQGKNFIKKDISIDTVLGVLNRLIGDQKKLYQARKAEKESYYFADIEDNITFKDYPKVTQEIIYLRNISSGIKDDRNSFTGSIKVNVPVFDSDYSKEFWGVLALNLDELYQFIINDNTKIKNNLKFDPLAVVSFFENLDNKAIENTGNVQHAVKKLIKTFGNVKYFNAVGKVVPRNLYCSALYVQLERLSNKYNMATAKTQTGKIKGISKRFFTKKDFMEKYTTGKKKIVFGNPYIYETTQKGEGRVQHLMTKASGSLDIFLNISKVRAKEIYTMINNAGVSSFYLGKKGLAYVTNIDTREEI